MYILRFYRSLAAQARGPGAMIGHASVAVFSGSGFAGLRNGAFCRFYDFFGWFYGSFGPFCRFCSIFCLKIKETRAFLPKNLMVRELGSTKTANFQHSTVMLFFIDRTKPRVSSIPKQKELLFVQEARRSREINALSLRKRELLCRKRKKRELQRATG